MPRIVPLSSWLFVLTLLCLTTAVQAQTIPTIGDIEPVTLTASDVERFLAASRELKMLGLTALSEDGVPNPNDPAQLAQLMQRAAQALQIIDKHGFTATEFQNVAYSIALAAGAVQAENNQGELEAAKQRLEAMKSEMSTQEYDEIVANIRALEEKYQNQPAGNIELARRYMDDLVALGSL